MIKSLVLGYFRNAFPIIFYALPEYSYGLFLGIYNSLTCSKDVSGKVKIVSNIRHPIYE